MIRELFLPERIGNRRLIPQKMIGISLQDDTVYAVQVYAKYGSNVVEQVWSESYEAGNQDSLVKALITLKERFGKYDRLMVTLPASIVVIKELELPFVDVDKIRMVLDYEIESMLPFAIEEAVVDFIVTESLPSLGTSSILAAAVRMQDLQNALDLYTRAGIDPAVVSVDLFSYYSLYQQIAAYQEIKQGSAFVDLGLFSTRVSFIQNGKMRMTRQIPRGLMTIVNVVAKETSEPAEQILENIKKVGISQSHEPNGNLAIQKQVINFFNDIQFTLNSFSLKANYYEGISKILFTGKSVEINDFMKFSSNLLQISCEIFDVAKLFEHVSIKSVIEQAPAHWASYAASLGVVLPSPILSNFTLRRKNFAPMHHVILRRQLMVAGLLMLFIIGFTAMHGVVQIAMLKKHIIKLEMLHKKKLAPLLQSKDRSKKMTLQARVKAAGKEVSEKEEQFSPIMKERVSPLQLMYEFTELIDSKKNELEIKEMLIEESTRGQLTIEVEGLFKTDQDKWKTWNAQILKRFQESLFLELVGEVYAAASDESDNGLKFKAKFKLKEVQDKTA